MTTDPFDSGAGDEEFGFDMGPEEMAPEGLAIVQCTNLEKQHSRTSGKPMYVWTFVIREYREPKDVGDSYNGEELLVFTSLSSAAMWKMQETLAAMGVAIPTEEDDAMRSVRFSRGDVLGVCALAALKHNTFEGRKRCQIDALRAHPDGAGTAMEMLEPAEGPDSDIPF